MSRTNSRPSQKSWMPPLPKCLDTKRKCKLLKRYLKHENVMPKTFIVFISIINRF